VDSEELEIKDFQIKFSTFRTGSDVLDNFFTNSFKNSATLVECKQKLG